MKKIAIVVVVTVLVTAAHAEPKHNSWYTGAKLGWSHFEDAGFNPEDKSVVSGKTKYNQVGSGAYLGFRHNQYLGFELGYDWLGRIKYPGNPNTGTVNSMGVQLSARLSYPITEELDVYTRIGSMVWRTDVQANVDNAVTYKAHDTSASPIYALGFEYAMTPEWATRLDYQWVSHVGDKSTIHVRPNDGMLSVGVVYRFKKSASPVIVPAHTTSKNKRFTLRTDAVFEFNKDTLNQACISKLDALYKELTELTPITGRVIVIGYTDRLGAPCYNKSLSEKRVHTVMRYLVSKGVPKQTIISEGRGEKHSITGSLCDNIKDRDLLINCLSPDRRVEITIQGTTKVAIKP